jgi:hypothetical protein
MLKRLAFSSAALGILYAAGCSDGAVTSPGIDDGGSSALQRAVVPDHFVIVEPFSQTYTCGLVEQGTFHRSFTVVYDRSGNERFTIERMAFDAVITNPDTNETFEDRGHWTARFKSDFSTGFSLSGIAYNIRKPGAGVLLLAVGRLIVDSSFQPVFQSARTVSFFEQDAAVCAALMP